MSRILDAVPEGYVAAGPDHSIGEGDLLPWTNPQGVSKFVRAIAGSPVIGRPACNWAEGTVWRQRTSLDDIVDEARAEENRRNASRVFISGQDAPGLRGMILRRIQVLVNNADLPLSEDLGLLSDEALLDAFEQMLVAYNTPRG